MGYFMLCSSFITATWDGSIFWVTQSERDGGKEGRSQGRKEE